MEQGQAPSISHQNKYCILENSFELLQTENKVHQFTHLLRTAPTFQSRFCACPYVLTIVVHMTAYAFEVKKDKNKQYSCKQKVRQVLKKAPIRVEYIPIFNELFYLSEHQQRVIRLIPGEQEDVFNFKYKIEGQINTIEVVDFAISQSGSFIIFDIQKSLYLYPYLEKRNVSELLTTRISQIPYELISMEWQKQEVIFSFLIHQGQWRGLNYVCGQSLGIRFSKGKGSQLKSAVTPLQKARAFQEYYNEGKKRIISNKKHEGQSILSYLNRSQDYFENTWLQEMKTQGCTENIIDQYIEIKQVRLNYLLLKSDQIVFQHRNFKKQPIVLFQNFYEGMEFMKFHEEDGDILVLARMNQMLHLLVFSIDWEVIDLLPDKQ